MSLRFWSCLLMAVSLPFAVLAETSADGVTSFASSDDSWKRSEAERPEVQPQENFIKSAGKVAMRNIFEAEQVFCYEVFPQDDNYNGYTLDGYPLRGFCGILNQELRDLLNLNFFSAEAGVDFDNTEQCGINPKIMLRFVKGVDYTDVLLSAPCHALVIYYGGFVNAYNYKPSADLIDTIVKNLQAKRTDFISPALLNQVVPVGVIQNQQHRNLVNKNKNSSNNEPIRKWKVATEQKLQAQENEQKRQNTGWNKLKTRIK